MNWYHKYAQETQVERTYTQADVEALAKNLIQRVWNSGMVTQESKYDEYHVQLAIDNDRELYELSWSLGEEAYDDVVLAIERELAQRENKIYEQRKKKLEGGDELQHIREVIKGKSWNAAKRALVGMMPMGKLPDDTMRTVDDDIAEGVFVKLYKASKGGTFVDIDAITHLSPFFSEDNKTVLKRLSEIKNWDVHGVNDNTNETRNKFIETQIFTALFGYKLKEPPETTTVYRGVARADAGVRPGDYVTPSRSYARSYLRGKKGAVLTEELPTDDLVINSTSHGYEAVELVYLPRGFEASEEQVERPDPPMTFRELYEQVNGILAFNLSRIRK